MKPSMFISNPLSSILRSGDHETVARNIMVILARTGDTFRDITWEAYSKERVKDGNFSTKEEKYFEDVVNWCTTMDNAVKFSPVWASIVKEELT